MHLPLSQWKSRGEQVGSTGFKRTQMWVRWAGQTAAGKWEWQKGKGEQQKPLL